MPAIKKKTSRTVRRKTATKRKSTAKPSTSRRAKSATRPRRSPSKPSRPKKIEEATFTFECTRPGCGYRIWREEKDDAGHLRFDLKCPKCHYKVFRCLGKGEPPQAFEAPLPEPEQLEFVDVNSLGLDSD